MSGWALFFVFVASLALVVAFVAYAGLAGRQLFRTVRRVQGEIDAATTPLLAKAALAQERAAKLEGRSAELDANVARLQASLRRMTVVVSALREGMAPFARVKRYLGR